MAVFRIEKTRDYTVMSNHHLRDMSLSLKAKGLLSLMLSLPENWDYTMKGLARICKDGIDSISGGIRELEEHGYLIRERVRGANGQLGSIEYTILEQPKEPTPAQEKPIQENPVQVNPTLVTPVQEEPAQLNKEESSNYPSRTDLSSTELSNPIQSNPPTPVGARMGTDGMGARESYRELILENIEYDFWKNSDRVDHEMLDEITELIVDTVCSARKTIRIAGDDYPAEVVKSRFLKLDSSHVQYVMDCMKDNTTYVRNIKKYLLAALYNAPTTINSYYSSLVQHDMYGDGQRGRGYMQEEITRGAVTLIVDGAKLSEQVFEKAVKKFLEEIQKSQKPKIYRGRQSLKQLASQNAGLANIEISDKNIKAFSRVAKKYHVDFALKKDTAAEQPRYLVFFKSRDADAITAAFQEFASRKMSREEKPSIGERLTQAKEQTAEKTEHRTIDREKVKVKDRSVQR